MGHGRPSKRAKVGADSEDGSVKLPHVVILITALFLSVLTPGIASAAEGDLPTPPSGASTANRATDRSGLVLEPQVVIDGPYSSVLARIDSTSRSAVRIGRVMIRPPTGAIVDGIRPIPARSEDGIAWYTEALVSAGSPLSGYEARFYGPADGAVVQVSWSTATDSGLLSVTITDAPTPKPDFSWVNVP